MAIARQILEVFAHRTAAAQIVMAVKQAFEGGVPEAPPRHADFADVQRQQLAQVLLHRRLRHQHRSWRHLLGPHAIGRSLSARRQRNPIPLLQFEQQRPRGHIFELACLPAGRACRVAPVPEHSQLLAQRAATPIWMRCQQPANLLQIGRTDHPPLDERRFVHEPKLGKRPGRSSVQNEAFFCPGLGGRLPPKTPPKDPGFTGINPPRNYDVPQPWKNLRCALNKTGDQTQLLRFRHWGRAF